MSSVQMPCCVCGKDVAALQHITDQLGRHYCEPCTFNFRQAAPIATDQTAPFQNATPDDTPKAPCSRCRTLLPETELSFIAGDLVCKACLSPSASSAAKRDPFSRRPRPADEALDKVKFHDTLFGGALITLALLLASFGIFFALYRFFPEAQIQNPAIAAGVRCIILVCSTAGLILSMAIAAGIMGGINFGYFGSLLYKSVIIGLGLGIFGFFTDQSETFAVIASGFRTLIILVALLSLFKIDFFEAFLLSFINSLLGWLLVLSLVSLMASLGASVANDDHGLQPTHLPNAAPTHIENDLQLPASTFPAHPFLNGPRRASIYAPIA